MSNEIGAVDWAAALAEIEADIAKLQATADVIRERMARAGVASGAGRWSWRRQVDGCTRWEPLAAPAGVVGAAVTFTQKR
jgi:hypothetical protein